MKQTSAYSIGVIISTYNNPAWLEKVLWGYLFQTHPADEIVIADDGSKEDTRRLIESFKDKLPIKHVWHEDNGFQKSRILNSAILASESDIHGSGLHSAQRLYSHTCRIRRKGLFPIGRLLQIADGYQQTAYL